jgi:hypothetical protein
LRQQNAIPIMGDGVDFFLQNSYSCLYMLDLNDLLIMAATLRTIGEIIAISVLLSVHIHIVKEKRVDLNVLLSMQREKAYLVAGLASILTGFAVELIARTFV